MAAVSGPQDRLFSQVQQLERVVRDKQAEASVAAKQVGASEVGGGEHQFGLGHFRQHVGSYFWAEPSDVLSSLLVARLAEHGCHLRTPHAALPQASAALAVKEEAQQAARSERLRREAAEQRADQLQVCTPVRAACTQAAWW